MNQKGCDASNAFDEELSDQEFSDDEAEAAFKKARKNNKKRANAAKDLEEGEVVDDFKPKRPKQFQQNYGGFNKQQQKQFIP